jgi:hypothetical protein
MASRSDGPPISPPSSIAALVTAMCVHAASTTFACADYAKATDARAAAREM